MLVEEISTKGHIHIYWSEKFNPFKFHGKVQLEFTIE